MIKSSISIFILALASLFLATSLNAQEDKALTVTGTVNLYGSVLVYPFPNWMNIRDASELLTQYEIKREQTNNYFQINIVPKGENFENYTKSINIYAIKSPEKIQFSNYVNMVKVTLYNNCKKGNLSEPILTTPLDNIALVTIVCGEVIVDSGKNFSTIMHMWLNNEDNFVVLSYDWRGEPFDITKDLSNQELPIDDESFTAFSSLVINKTILINSARINKNE